MKSSTKNGIKNSTVKCTNISCAGCERCMAGSSQEACPLRSEWKSSTQLYGAEAHSYDFYFLHLQISVLKKEVF